MEPVRILGVVDIGYDVNWYSGMSTTYIGPDFHWSSQRLRARYGTKGQLGSVGLLFSDTFKSKCDPIYVSFTHIWFIQL